MVISLERRPDHGPRGANDSTTKHRHSQFTPTHAGMDAGMDVAAAVPLVRGVSTRTLERKRVVITAMQRASEAEGGLSNARVRAAAEMLECTPTHVRRLVRTGVNDLITCLTPTEEHIDMLFATHGNCAKAAREIAKRNKLPISAKTKKPVSERTMRRALEEHTDAPILAAARGGWAGFRTAAAYGTKYAPHKGHTYATDSTPFDVLVVDENTGEAIDLWGTPVIDEATRFVISVNTTNGSPDTQTSVAALAAAVEGYEAKNGVWIGGMPDRVLSDNGSEYKTSAVAAGLVRLGFTLVVGDGEKPVEEFIGSVRAQYTRPGQPWTNGIVERWHRLTHVEFCSSLPGYVDPGLDTFERLERRKYWQDNPQYLLTRPQFEALLHDWVMTYNYERVHSSLGSQTPFEAWCADLHVLAKPDPESVRLAMLTEGTRVVDKGSIKAFTKKYHSAALKHLHGRTVEIRYLPGRTESIEVFHNGIHVGTATRSDLLTIEELGQITKGRDKQTQTVLAHMAAGERLKTVDVNKRLVEKGFRKDDLPEIADEAPPVRGRRRSGSAPNETTPSAAGRSSRAAKTTSTSKGVTKQDRDDLAALINAFTTNPEEEIF